MCGVIDMRAFVAGTEWNNKLQRQTGYGGWIDMITVCGRYGIAQEI